jgi:hypothetical protein
MSPYDDPAVSAGEIADYLDQLRLNSPGLGVASTSNTVITLSIETLPEAYSSNSHSS